MAYWSADTIEQSPPPFEPWALPADSPASLDEVLRGHAAACPQRRACTFLLDGEIESASLTYGELDLGARRIGALLQQAEAHGERALLLYPPGLDFILAFLGCLYGGAVAVPVYPPGRSRHLARLSAIAADARPRVILTVASLLPRIRSWVEQTPVLAGIRVLATDGLEESPDQEGIAPRRTPGEIAFLQYTSGSTSTPKGVQVTHANLLHNEEAIRQAFGQSEGSRIVSWLPLYHDMGLIGGVLQPLYLGACCILMAPLSFLQRPRRWLEAISRYRATTSGGPNFGYDLCVRQIGPAERSGLDLSSWSVAFNGAEPVRAETLERFAEAFSPCGFRGQAFFPCYGLAEATLLVSGGKARSVPKVERVSAAALQRHQVVEPVAGEGAQLLVGCGSVADGQGVIIVDPETRQLCPPDLVGEIWVSGPSVAGGYWNRPEETAHGFGACPAGSLEDGTPYLRTGDLGFLRHGELFVAGRLKDLIILRGRNYYPQDLELEAERAHTALRPGCGAAFSIPLEGEERLVVVYEAASLSPAAADEVMEAVRRALSEELGLAVHEVVLLRAGTVPRTSSGKVQRHACRQGYLAGELTVVARSVREGQDTDPEEADAELSRRTLAALPAEAQRSALERFLYRRVARAAGAPVSRIDPGLPLTALGLDSLRVVELGQDLERRLGTAVPVARLLQGPSLTELAADLLRGLEAAGAGPQVSPQAVGEEIGEHPLSHGQRALWFLHRLAPESAAYNLAAAARVGPELDPEALHRACAALVLRHSALRTTFYDYAGEPVQRVHGEAGFLFTIEDASAWSEADLRQRLRRDAVLPFDLETGPLLRLTLLRRSGGNFVLLVVIHHIVVDFASMAVVARELGDLYAEMAGGRTADLEAPPLRFSDWCRWQREHLAAPGAESLWSYWLGRLEGAPFLLDLPTDRPHPAVQTYAGGLVTRRLEPGLSAALARLAQGTTLFTVLLAAYQALLHRYTGDRTLLVGSPTAGRSKAVLAPLVGYFVNPVVLRSDVPDDPPVPDLLARTWRTVLGALEHQDLPFAMLAERLQPSREPSRSPVFQTLFVFHFAPRAGEEALVDFALKQGGAKLAWGGLTLESMPLEEEAAPFDLVLTFGSTGEGLTAGLQYNRDLFDASTARRMLGHLECLLGGLGIPSRRLSDLPLLSDAERWQLLVEWTAAPAGPADACLHALVERQAERTPDRVAVIDGPLQLTYQTLCARAGRLACRLSVLGSRPESLVALLAERSADMVAGLLGILRSGAAYLPLDPAYPRERLSFMLADSAVSVLLGQGHLLERLGEEASCGVRVCLLEELEGEGEAAAGAAAPAPGNLAYAIYTSGSTGRPKGVGIEHRSAAAFVAWARAFFAAEDLAGVVAGTSICFDLSVFEIFAPLSRGGTVILADSALSLSSSPAAQQATLLNTVPSVLAEALRLGPLPVSVRTVNLAGEPLPGSLVRGLHEQSPALRVFNFYGPSEDTTYSTGCEVPRGSAGEPTIGRPLPKTRGYVLDAGLQPAPLGVPGELFLGGVCLARGYLGRPDLTAERFVPDPFSGGRGDRLYRTGDLVRRRPDGEIEFLGRIDHQVKLRGFRIELAEIETVLRSHPDVEEAAAAVYEDAAGERHLGAWFVLAPERSPETGVLRQYLRERLPVYMLPALLVPLAAMPLTASGKLDRRALPAPEKESSGTGAVGSADPLAELVSGAWADLLSLERVGPEDHFFELGGHSLLASRLAARLGRTFQVELSVRDLFEHPTPASLVRRITAAMREDGRQEPPIPRAPAGQAVPPSSAQQRLWLLDRLSPGNIAFNVPVLLRLAGRLDESALRHALNRVVERHGTLRTTFELVAGRPVQIVAERQPFALCRADLTSLPPGERESEALRRATFEARRPFDLSRGPLLRGLLLRQTGSEHLLLLVMHHIVSDAWSLSILLREISSFYNAAAGRETLALADLPLQYADFAAWQHQGLQEGSMAAQLAYWRERLAGAPPLLELPADRPRPEAQTYRGLTCRRPLPGDLGEELRRLGRRHGATFFMVFLAAFKVLLRQYLDRDDIVVGTDVANRSRVETEPLVGFFVNQLVMRTDLRGNPSFAALLERVRETALGAYANQDLPFERLFEALRPERSLKHPPLFQVKLIQSSLPANLPDLSGLAPSLVDLETGTSKLDLVVEVLEGPGDLCLNFNYNSDLFTADRITRMMDDFLAVLRHAAAHPEATLAEMGEALLRSRRRAPAGGPRRRAASFEKKPVPKLNR